MSPPFTCPHCETALTVPLHGIGRRVLCPQCHTPVPQSAGLGAGVDDQPPVFATALDGVEWDQFADRWLGTVQPLAVMGAFGIYFFASAFFYSLVQRRLERDWIVIIALSGATLVCGVCWLGVHLTRHARRNGTRILGWLIIGNCAFVGGGMILGIFVVVCYALIRQIR